MGDYDYEIQEGMAQRDERDAAALEADATTLRSDAATDHAQAAAVQAMGLPGEGQALEVTATFLEGEAGNLDAHAGLLHHAAGLERQEADVFRERDTAKAGASAAEDPRSRDRNGPGFRRSERAGPTRWLGEQGAATGEAAALKSRADALTNQAIDIGHQADAERDLARDGLPGRQWPGVGHPSNQTPGSSGAE